MVKQAKKNGKNQEEVAPPAEAVAVTYLPPTEAQWKVMKMRNRDILDANKKMIDMELKAQAEALEADEKNRGMVTFSACCQGKICLHQSEERLWHTSGSPKRAY